MSVELKPCPFCGGKGRLSFKDYAFGGRNGRSDVKKKYRLQIICNKCKSRGKPIITDWLINPDPYRSGYTTPEYPYSHLESQEVMFRPYVIKAVEAWNRRAG